MSRFKKTLVGSVSALAMTAGLALGVDAAEPYDADALNALQPIVPDASALPEPITRDQAASGKVELETVERAGRRASTGRRRVGKEGVRQCRPRWWRNTKKKKNKK